MSRYVDLDGNTWDGTPITSKIQEVETRLGYLQGITIGWLWGDNVPHIDLEEHDKKIRIDTINEIIKLVDDELTTEIGMDLFVNRDLICERLEKLKEEK